MATFATSFPSRARRVQRARDLRADAPLDADSINEVIQTLTLYSTSLTYLLSKKDGDRLDQSIVSQLDAYMRDEDRPPLASERMTGGTPFEEVQELLDRLEDPDEQLEYTYERLRDELGDVESALADRGIDRLYRHQAEAIDAVRDGTVTILPEADRKVYFHWLENIEPWCVSRQLWSLVGFVHWGTRPSAPSFSVG